MNLLNKFSYLVKTITIISICLVTFALFPTIASAKMCMIEGPAAIQNGTFTVTTKSDIPAFTVRSAIVYLPEEVSGDIDSINITGPDNKPEFGCVNIKGVTNGTNLISACGGPAVLKAGNTLYQAKGSNFAPGDQIKFSIQLCDDFVEES